MPKYSHNKRLFELIAKLRTMAARGGTPAEKSLAELKLKELSEKYSINPDEYFIDIPKKKRVFKVADWNDYKNIMVHCILDTAPFTEITGNESELKLIANLSTKEFDEVLKKFSHYYELFRKEKEALLVAFILKNNLGIIDNEMPDDKIEEDINSILKYLSILDNNQISKNKMLW